MPSISAGVLYPPELVPVVSTVPLVQKDLIKVFGKKNAPDLEKEVYNLNNLYKQNSFYIKPIGDGFMMVSKKDFEPYISKLIPSKKLMLSNAALEVLAIIAYKQPIPRLSLIHISEPTRPY